MHLLFRRIAIHGLLTAAILAALGYVLAEFASMSITTSAGARGVVKASPEATASVEDADRNLHVNIPLMMALWGFGFVAIIEMIRHQLHRARRAAAAALATPPVPDETEKLLEELLTQAESKAASHHTTATAQHLPEANPNQLAMK
jgi:hypothetical protein